MKPWFFPLAVLVGWAGFSLQPPPAAAARPEPPALERLREVEKRLEGQTSVSGRFTMEKKFDHLAETLRSEGRFFFARPDYLVWEQTAPEWFRLELENGRAETWNGSPAAPVPAETEVAGQVARAIMGWMSFDPQAIAAGYEVFVERPEPLVLTARPRRPGARKYLEALQIEFALERPVVRRVVLKERGGFTILTFDQILLNQPRPEPGHGRLGN
jgi:hypothetical protein